MDQEDFDLVGGEEAPWACVQAVSKAKMLVARRDKLVPVLIAGLLAFVVEAVAVEGVRVGVDGFIFHGVGGHDEHCSLGNKRAIGQSDVCQRVALKGGWKESALWGPGAFRKQISY